MQLDTESRACGENMSKSALLCTGRVPLLVLPLALSSVVVPLHSSVIAYILLWCFHSHAVAYTDCTSSLPQLLFASATMQVSMEITWADRVRGTTRIQSQMRAPAQSSWFEQRLSRLALVFLSNPGLSVCLSVCILWWWARINHSFQNSYTGCHGPSLTYC